MIVARHRKTLFEFLLNYLPRIKQTQKGKSVNQQRENMTGSFPLHVKKAQQRQPLQKKSSSGEGRARGRLRTQQKIRRKERAGQKSKNSRS